MQPTLMLEAHVQQTVSVALPLKGAARASRQTRATPLYECPSLTQQPNQSLNTLINRDFVRR